MKAALVLAFFALPAAAQASVLVHCESVNYNDQIKVTLRLDNSGETGSIEAEYWNGYPPLTLVYAELKTSQKKGGQVVFTSEKDKLSGYSAEFGAPADFIEQNAFGASLKLNIPARDGNPARAESYQLGCKQI